MIRVVVKDQLLEVPEIGISLTPLQRWENNSPLPLRVENLHVQVEMSDLLLTSTL